LSGLRRGKEIFSAFTDVLQKSELQESILFREVNDRLKKSKGRGISHRDFRKEAVLSVKEGRLGSREDKQSEAHVKPVYYFLTESYLKKYQRYDFVEIDQEKDRQRKLFELLLLYETCRRLKCTLRTKGRTSYIVDDLPGFTPQEILRFPMEQAGFAKVPWFHPSCIFIHMKFEMNEIDEAVKTLETKGSITPFSLTKESYHNHRQPLEVRYRINDKLRGLMELVWSLYKEKLSILETKYQIETFNNDDRSWLSYLLGIRNTEKVMQEWKDRRRERSINEDAIEIRAGRLVLTKRSYTQMREMEFKVKVDELLERCLPVLREYDLPDSLVRTILS
jgi:hypothetical protein